MIDSDGSRLPKHCRTLLYSVSTGMRRTGRRDDSERRYHGRVRAVSNLFGTDRDEIGATRDVGVGPGELGERKERPSVEHDEHGAGGHFAARSETSAPTGVPTRCAWNHAPTYSSSAAGRPPTAST